MKEKKTKFNSFCVYLIMVIFFVLYGSISVYAQTGVSDVWFVPLDSSVRVNAGFTVDVNVNSGGQPLAAYGFEISYDAGMISVNTSVGTEGVVAGSDGYIAAANASTSGLLSVSGFDASGTGPGSNLNIITINFTAGGTTGTSSLELTVNDLYDADLNVIGTPVGINGNVTISEILPGDVNESGIVDIIDALLNAQAYVGLNPSGYNPAAADVNCDGSGDIVDSLLIAQYYVGLTSGFPCSGVTPPPTPTPDNTPVPADPPEGVELLSNGDFSSGTDNWTINFYETAAGSSSVTGETPPPTKTPVPTETPEPTLTPTPYTRDGAELVLNGDFGNGG